MDCVLAHHFLGTKFGLLVLSHCCAALFIFDHSKRTISQIQLLFEGRFANKKTIWPNCWSNSIPSTYIFLPHLGQSPAFLIPFLYFLHNCLRVWDPIPAIGQSLEHFAPFTGAHLNRAYSGLTRGQWLQRRSIPDVPDCWWSARKGKFTSSGN